MAANRGHGDISRPDLVDELMDFLAQVVTGILERIDGDEFTTAQFIELMQTDGDGKRAYDEAVRRWGEDEHLSKMVIHGQVIPGILRRSPLLEWAGYAHGDVDPFGVPAWWTMTRQEPGRRDGNAPV